MTNKKFKTLIQFHARKQIAKLLEQTEYFHGTGRFLYSSNGNSKYEGVTDAPHDTLNSLATDGLKPQNDLFADLFTGKEIPTISMTHLRNYARVYADLFSQEGTGLGYEYGTRKFWWNYLLMKMFFDALTDPGHYRRTWQRRKEIKKFKMKKRNIYNPDKWASSFRNDSKYNGSTMRLIQEGKSTITGNYPMIIGIRKGTIKPIPIISRAVRRYETRTDQTISPGQWSYIEVPLRKITETRETLSEVNGKIDIPIIPMEFVELLLSEKPFSELIAPGKDWKALPIKI